MTDRPSASFADVDYDEAMRRARALVPVLRERAAAAELGREMPGETIADLHRTGLLRFHQPRRCSSGWPRPARKSTRRG